MITPAASPLMTENEMPTQLSILSRYSMANVATAMSAAAVLVPMPKECNRSFIDAPSLVRTM